MNTHVNNHAWHQIDAECFDHTENSVSKHIIEKVEEHISPGLDRSIRMDVSPTPNPLADIDYVMSDFIITPLEHHLRRENSGQH